MSAIYDGGEAEYHDPISGAQTQRQVAGSIFDAWLAAHDAALFAALSTPPADDVREALAHILWEAAVGDNPEGVPGESWEELLAEEPVWAQGYYFQADAAMRAFEVLPRGTVIEPKRPYSEAVDVEHGAWETDDIEERAHDLLAVVAFRRAEAAREVHP